jgi:DNA adenine methylase
MFLNRIGNKKRIAEQIYCHFPPHSVYLEPFFGCGGMLFQKPIAEDNIVNDNNGEVINCFMVAMKSPKELQEALEIMPYHKDLLDYFKTTTNIQDPVMRALKMLFLSNFTFMGHGETLKFTKNNQKIVLLKNLKNFFKSDFIKNTKFQSCDFRKFFKNLNYRNHNDKNKAFCYSDPPYLYTGNNYSEDFKQIKWTEQDFLDLIQIHIESGLRFAISEFDTPFIVEIAKQNKLNIIDIGERHNLNNKRVKILITNYDSKNVNLNLF